jgi:hypothetical protein
MSSHPLVRTVAKKFGKTPVGKSPEKKQKTGDDSDGIILI